MLLAIAKVMTNSQWSGILYEQVHVMIMHEISRIARDPILQMIANLEKDEGLELNVPTGLRWDASPNFAQASKVIVDPRNLVLHVFDLP